MSRPCIRLLSLIGYSFRNYILQKRPKRRRSSELVSLPSASASDHEVPGFRTRRRFPPQCSKCQMLSSDILPKRSFCRTYPSTLAWNLGLQLLVPTVQGSLPCKIAYPPSPCSDLISIKVLTGDLDPMSGHVTKNGRLRVYGFAAVPLPF